MENIEEAGLDTSTPAESSGELYSIKVDGVETQVSLEELQSGYQRQSDYTRKTQELSRERERLAQGEAIVQALESDPHGAIASLGEAFGVGNMGNQTSEAESFEDLDPEEVRLRRLESSIEHQEKALRQQNLQKEMNSLRDRYGTDINEHQLFSHALKHNIGNLDAAYTHMTYGDMRKKVENAGIVEEKRAATIVEDKGGVAESNVERAVEAVSSIREAYMLAVNEHE